MSTGEEGGAASEVKQGTHTQFRKGQSGNPKGRPRKASGTVGAFPTEVTQLIKTETERLLTLTEGGKPVVMPALQAVLRSTVVSAAKGNSHAQRTVLQLALAAQAQEAKTKRDEYEEAMLLKVQLDYERNVWVANGHPELAMLRHSSDIEINPETCSVKSYLIFTQEDFEARQKAINLRDFLIEEIARLLRVAEIDGDDRLLQMRRESAIAVIDRLNAMLPPRFRRFLSEPDCALAGKSPAEIWKSMGHDLASALMAQTTGGRQKRAIQKLKQDDPTAIGNLGITGRDASSRKPPP